MRRMWIQAYCDEGLVNEVVVPLLSMESSVLLCISTLLDGANHYTKMINLKDENGNKVFESLQISLVCEACLKTEHPERCTHKVRIYHTFNVSITFLLTMRDLCGQMSEIPRWISSKKVEIVRTLLSEDPAMLLRETLGISADGSEKLLRDDDITAFEHRPPERLVWHDRDHRRNVMHTFTAVDPSGGGASAFSIASAITLPNGTIQVRDQVCALLNSSTVHSLCIVPTIATKASGRWPMLARNNGPMSGRIRRCKSASTTSSSEKYEFDHSGKRQMAKSRIPRLQATAASKCTISSFSRPLSITISMISRSAERNARELACSAFKKAIKSSRAASRPGTQSSKALRLDKGLPKSKDANFMRARCFNLLPMEGRSLSACLCACVCADLGRRGLAHARSSEYAHATGQPS